MEKHLQVRLGELLKWYYPSVRYKNYIMEGTQMGYRHYHHHHHRHSRGGSDDSGMGCLVMIILGMVAMPLVGLYMLFTGKDDGQKAIGVVLTIVGIIIWIAAAQG